MKNRRYSDNDKHLWPFTLSKLGSWKPFGIMLDSGGDPNDSQGGCTLQVKAFGYALIVELPQIIPTYKIRHYPKSWTVEDVVRIGRDWYDEIFAREYGFHFSDKTLHVHYGPQTHDSRTTKSKCYFLPWLNWTFKRMSYYDLDGKHFWTEPNRRGFGVRGDWIAKDAVEKALPKAKFEFDDYDSERIVATTHIEEREWHFGEGLFGWLRFFRKPMIQRSLYLDFSKEVGPEKGSWKGGTCGHSIEMLPGEMHEAAFRRYCELEHRSKYRRFKIAYVGRIEDPVIPPTNDEGACKASEAA